MNIPKEAVEAAAKYVWDKSNALIPWSRATRRARAIYVQDAQWALEGAAPYVLADYLTELSADVKARGDIGKEGGLEAWDYLTWKAERLRNPL